MFKEIFVLESSWDANNPLEHSSIMPIVSEFAKQRNIKSYHQVFTDAKSFNHWIAEFNKSNKNGSLLYIASHGNRGSLHALNGGIKRNTVISALRKAKNIKYVHFGSCLFGNQENLKLILKTSKHIHWVAGYNISVDWVDSTLFDILLWGRITPSGRFDEHKNTKTHTIVKDLVENKVEGLVKELGFQFAYRYGTTIFPK